jgi:hypothetical protein
VKKKSKKIRSSIYDNYIPHVNIIGESLLPNNKEEGMLTDTNRDHLLQLDIKEEPRLSPNVKINGESRLQEKHKYQYLILASLILSACYRYIVFVVLVQYN